MQNVIAVILAGGEGTRFRPYTDIVPKPMLPIGPEEKPILEYIVKWIRRFGVRDIVFLVGYRWKQIRNYFGDGSRFGVNIRYSIDNDVYSGTGGALLNAYRQGLLGREIVLVWYGDIIAPVNVVELLEMHRSRDADAVIVLSDRYRVPVGVAKVDGDRVVGFEEKPWLNVYVSVAILTLNPSILAKAGEALGTKFDVMGDMVPWMIAQNYRVYAYVHRGPWYDVGGIEQYKKLRIEDVTEFVSEDQP